MTYLIAPTLNPPTASVMESYREVRLAALRTDPEYFSSTYEREAAFTEETWRERLTGSGKATFVAQALAGSGAGEESDVKEEGRGSYVGTVTVLAGRNVRASAIPSGADAARTYFVYGMWVQPEHRRVGLGRRLMEALLAWARKDTRDSAFERRDDGEEGFEVWLAVAPADEPARKLYTGLEFREVHGGLEQQGKFWMRRTLGKA